MKKSIGSTGKGVGAAIIGKVSRAGIVNLARDHNDLQSFLGDVATRANELIDSGGHIFLEGTQGFGLSLHHGFYPYVTSRETNAASLAGEAGISPLLIDQVILVIRTYPIRVAGNSGPLRYEVTWETVTKESKSPTDLIEKTTVTKKVRRVAKFDLDLVKKAVMLNRPTQLAINFIDYIDFKNKGICNLAELTADANKFINMVEEETGVPVTLLGTGPNNADIIDLREQKL